MATTSSVNKKSTDAKSTLVKKARDLFRTCDRNDNGFINKRDIWRLSEELPLTPEQLEEVFFKLDEDKSDYLTEEEFVQGFASYLGVDLNKIQKEEEDEAKNEAERKEEEELEEFLNKIDEQAIENNQEANKLWNKEKHFGEATSEFESVIEDLGKELRKQGVDEKKEVRKDFFSLHKYYYGHIYSVMQRVETEGCNEANGKVWESLDPIEPNKPSLQKGSGRNSIRSSDASKQIKCDKDCLSSLEQGRSISPPVKARKGSVKSTDESLSTLNRNERRHSSRRKLTNYQFKDYTDCYLSNLPVINSPDRLFNIIFVGDSGVGKTTFIRRFCCDRFVSAFQATVGIDYRVKTFSVEGRLVAFQLWDTAGQERYRSFSRQYFRKADGIIFMYDITSELSFRNVRNWMAHAKENSEHALVYAVIGNKTDLLQNEKQVVISKIGEELAKKHESLFYETSCKTGEGVWNIMNQMACALQHSEDREIEKIYEFHKFKEENKCC